MCKDETLSMKISDKVEQLEKELDNLNINVSGIEQGNTKLRERNCENKNLKTQNTVLESCIQDKSNEIIVLNAALNTALSDLEREKSINNFLSQEKLPGHKNFATPVELKTPVNDNKFVVVDSWELGKNNTVDHKKSQHLEDKDGCKTSFLHGPKTCRNRKCKKNHSFNFRKIERGICYQDFFVKGSCKRGERCRFSHETPKILRSDVKFINELTIEKDKFAKVTERRKSRVTPVKENDINISKDPSPHTPKYKPAVPSNEYSGKHQTPNNSQPFLRLIRTMIQDQMKEMNVANKI